MTDQTTEPSATDGVLPAAFTPAQVENFLTLDQIMNSARRSRRVAKICLAADLEAEYLAALEELGELVDEHGQTLNDETTIGDGELAALRERIAEIHTQMQAQTFSVMFEAMDSDAWEIFEKKHRNADGKVKDIKAWQDELITECAINPTFTAEQVAATRTKLGATQINELATKAYSACTSGGVDVPKLPSFWHSPKPQESSLS